jgi:hypothetical protein
MAFDLNRFTRTTLAFNSGAITLTDSSVVNGPALFTYATADDNAAAVAAAGYFNPVSAIYDLAVGDIIMGNASDASFALKVATVDRTANPRTITTESMSLTGTVQTANIANSAVTTAKIADEAVTSAKVVETLIQHAQVDVDLADFIGSNTASVVLVAAPGSGKKIILHRASLRIDYGGTVLAAGGTVQLQYANDTDAGGTFATGTLAAATLIAATADTSFGFSPVDTTLTDATTLNEGLYLSTATQDFTGGTGSAYKVDVWYSVADFN